MHEPLVQANVREHIPVVPEMHGHVAHDILVPCSGVRFLCGEDAGDAEVSLGGIRDDLPHGRHGRLVLALGLAVDIVLGLASDLLLVEPS